MTYIDAFNATYELAYTYELSDHASLGFDSSWVQTGIEVPNVTGAYGVTRTWGALSEVWCSFRMSHTGLHTWTTTHQGFTVCNSSGVQVFRIRPSATGILIAEYWNGAWTAVSAAFPYAIAANKWDIRLKVHATQGAIEIYRGGTLESSATNIDTSAMGNLHYGIIARLVSSSTFFSEVIIDTESTITYRYKCNPPTGNGAHTAWTGDYTAVDEASYNLSDAVSSGTADQKETFTAAARSFTSMSVKAVQVSFLALKGQSGPSKVRGLLRKGGVDYESADIALTYGYSGRTAVFTTDPSTGLAWAVAAAEDAALEFGLRSVA